MKPTSGKALTEKTKEIIENNLNFGIGIDINKKTYDLIERGTTLSKEDLREWLLLELQKPESERYNERSGLSHVLHMLDHPEKEEK